MCYAVDGKYTPFSTSKVNHYQYCLICVSVAPINKALNYVGLSENLTPFLLNTFSSKKL